MTYTLHLRQRFTLVQNRYDVARVEGGAEEPLAYAEQKRLALRERVTFYRDERRREVAFVLAARNVVELIGSYEVTGASGELLGTLRKDAVASLARSTYRLETPGGELVGRERTWWRPLARRVVEAAGDLPWLLPLQFDVTDRQGRVVMAVDRRMRLRDVYRVTVHDDGLDWRLAAAFAVAVDAFMNR